MFVGRATRAAGLASLAFACGAGTVACFDLFHSTTSIVSACELDAATCPADGDAATEASAPTDFCAWTSDTARQNAAHACAWLGACETPFGSNAFGSCMFEALLAYDCAANPNHPPRGVARAQWDCLWQVASCADVDRCIFPDSPPGCTASAGSTSCGSGRNAAVRLQCLDGDGGKPAGESCALSGKDCALGASATGCAGATGAAGLSCPQAGSGCTGTALHACTATGTTDLGIDCASNGAGQCTPFGSASLGKWVACQASGDAGCAPDPTVTCNGGVASSCPSGVQESINCLELLGVGDPDAGCVAGPPAPELQFDWTAPCMVTQSPCTGDSCSPDGTSIFGCARGATFTTSCAMQGLGTCTLVGSGSAQGNAQCAPPP